MKRKTITANYLQTISWFDKTIVDWASAGQQYALDGKVIQLNKYHFAFSFDGAITSALGTYAFIYQRFGTKALLLKNGEIIKEINRTYYCANSYEFPCAFVEIDNTTYLLHCPIAYNQLDFENVETGELVTNIPGRKPADIFHSRLEISPDGSLLMDKGWMWHPVDRVCIFNIKDCFKDPGCLDTFDNEPPVDVEVSSANFIDDNRVLIGSSEEVFDEDSPRMNGMDKKNIAIWDLKTNSLLNPTAVNVEFGNLFAINETFAWDLFEYPKIININTGQVVDADKTIDSGKQNSALILADKSTLPQIVFNYQTKQIAISGKEKIEILTPELDYSH